MMNNPVIGVVKTKNLTCSYLDHDVQPADDQLPIS